MHRVQPRLSLQNEAVTRSGDRDIDTMLRMSDARLRPQVRLDNKWLKTDLAVRNNISLPSLFFVWIWIPRSSVDVAFKVECRMNPEEDRGQDLGAHRPLPTSQINILTPRKLFFFLRSVFQN